MGLGAGLVCLGLLVFASASFFFAVAESALFALGKWRARQLVERWPREGALVLQLLEHPAELLGTIVLGNTLANGGIVALALWPALRVEWPLGWTLAGIFAGVLLVCEVLPKTLGVRAPDRWAIRLARPMIALSQATSGLQRLVQKLNGALIRWFLPKSFTPRRPPSEEEYAELLEMAFQQGTLAASRKEIILQIISLDRKTAKDVMKPRSTMAAISDELTVDEMVAAARKFRHRRLPIYDESPDTIVGVLNVPALLLDPKTELADAIEFPSFVPESMNLLQLLKSLERQKRRLAIVLDEFGGTAGLVTIEDILEAVVGEIHGKAKPRGFVMERLATGRWRVSGSMRLDDFRREYPALVDVPEVDTLNGLMVRLMEVVPVVGESVQFYGLRLTAHAVEERRVRELIVDTVKKR